MEKKAIDLYRQRSKDSQSEEEAQLYSWLVSWEDDHLNTLIALDKELQEKIWYDNNF